MNRTQRYILNGAILSLGAIFIRAISVSFNIYLTSKIGAEGMGLITLIGSVYGLFITLATSGINLAVTRLVSASYAKESDGVRRRRSLDGIIKSAITYALIFSLSASVILLLSAKNISVYILKDERCILPLRILAFTLTPIAISSVLNGYFSGRMQIHKNVAVSLTEQLTKIALSALFLTLVSKKTVTSLCCAVILSGALSEGVSLIAFSALYLRDIRYKKEKVPSCVHKRGISIDLNKGEDSFSTLFYLAFPVGVSAYVRSALSSIEHIAIPWGLTKNSSDPTFALSSYGILHGMVFPLLLFPSAVLGAFSSLLVPELSSASARGEDGRIRRAVSGVMGLSLLFSMGVSGIFIAFSRELGLALYGSMEAAEYIRLLSPLIPLMYLDGAVDSMLKGLGEQLYCMRVNICDSLLSIILILTLLPTMGIRGYVAVIFITELLNTALSLIHLLNITGADANCVKWVLKPLISVISSTLITKALFKVYPLSLLTLGNTVYKSELILKIAICALFYLIISRVSGAISERDIKKARGILDLSTRGR